VYPVHLHDVNTGEYILDESGKKQYDPGSYTDSEGNVISTRNQYADRHVFYENELNYDKSVRNTLNATAYAELILPYGFSAIVKGNLNTRNNRNYTYNSAVIGDGKGSLGRAKRVEYSYKTYTFQQQITWNHEFGSHAVDVLLGHENYSNEYNHLYAYKTNEIVPSWGNFSNFTKITSLDGSDDVYKTESYLGRVHYNYADRYNVEASFRRDGSSRFHKDSRWGSFWSIGTNWIISNEQFMEKCKWIDFLKLRADYGEVGNDAGAGYYAYQALYSVEQNANTGALYLTQFPNRGLKWETGQSWGVAAEGRLFNRWNLSLEYFDKRNKDLLFDVYLPLSAGGTTSTSAESVVTKNLGTISNRGFEISTDVDVYQNRNWRINVGANLTYIKNKIVKLPEQNKKGIIEEKTYKYIVEGRSRYDFYVYTYEGVDSHNGYALYKFNDGDAQGNSYRFELDGVKYGNWDVDETGAYVATEITGTHLDDVVVIDGTPYSYVTNYAKKEFHGSALAPIYGSFNLGVTWKRLSFNALFTYQVGGKVIDDNYRSLMTVGSTPASFHQDALRSWTVEDGTDDHAIWSGDVPVLNNNLSSQVNAISSRWLTSASYLVLKNLNLSYQLPQRWMNKLQLQGIDVNVSCDNLFSKTARKGMNPQQSFNGTQYNYLVTPRVFSVGLNLKF
ncbi:MAG: TonB-dependent receptor, partial [Odoribacter sp.]|nr:TonB-dependent receptor [Odoribacter sp.]